MQETRREIIHASPTTVWEFAVDVERWPEVMDHITTITRQDDGEFGMGSAAVLDQPRLPASVWTVDVYEPGRRFRWSGGPFGIEWTADHIIEPVGDGTTRLTLEVTASGWQATLLGTLLRREAQKALRLETAGFREACE